MKDEELMAEAMKLVMHLENYNSAFGNGTETIRKLAELIEELTADKEPASIVWEPKIGETYHGVAADGIVRSTWRDDHADKDFLKHRNVYKTQGQAKKAAKYQQRYNMVLQAVLNLEPDQVIDWKDKEQSKYQPYFDHQAGVWRSWGKHYTQPLENGYPPLTDEKNLQPLLDYLNRKEKENG